ncbi:MAG: AarF/ABC1/UbiB kinase family protein [Bacteroidota bacterium]
MKEQKRIPTSKVQRATKFIKTGAKIGGNYVKHYTKKVFNPNLPKEELHSDNAADIYDSLSELKGSALKVAQMLSMDKNMLPTAYQQQFTMAQYSAPPLSYPLVVKTFKETFGKAPTELYDSFTKQAVNAASIGQVHLATLDDKKLAVKIQYPGVADSVSSDLKIVKPMATRLFNISVQELDQFIGEVESKLLEETDYDLELQRSVEISSACSHLIGLNFPNYYPEYSGKRVITMDWMDGEHLDEFLKTNPSQEVRNQVGQALWDFYDFQIHTLKQVHADPHPGNFMFRQDGTLGVIDFGCVKVIPTDFYDMYFQLMRRDVLNSDPGELDQLFHDLQFITEKDSAKEKSFFSNIFKDMIELLGRPFRTDSFDFGDDEYFKKIWEMGEMISNMKEFRHSKTARGSKHGLYINRTYFGLYTILNDLKANVSTIGSNESSLVTA